MRCIGSFRRADGCVAQVEANEASGHKAAGYLLAIKSISYKLIDRLSLRNGYSIIH